MIKPPPIEPLPPLRPPSAPDLAEQARKAGHDLSPAARAMADAPKLTVTKPIRGTEQPAPMRENGISTDDHGETNR